MSTQLNKNLLKKLVGMAGVASASVLLGLPVLAQVSPNVNAEGMNQPATDTNVQSDSPINNRELSDSTMSETERNNVCGGYEGNGTTGGGYYCAMGRMNSRFSDRTSENNTQSETFRRETSNTNNGGSTTGAGYPGNNVRPQGMDKSLNQESSTPDSNSDVNYRSQAPYGLSFYQRSEIDNPQGVYNEAEGVWYLPGENLVVP